MTKTIKSILFFSLFFILFPILVSAEEVTITTYYPSPYGMYRELRSKRIAIGDNYVDGGNYTWETTDGDGGEVDYNADLIVEGNAGIGIAAPQSKLDIRKTVVHTYPTPGAVYGALHISPENTAAADNSTSITFGASQGITTAQAGIYVQSSGGYGTKMYFGTTNVYATGSQIRMMIDHTGNVGIGTISPAYKLHISNAGAYIGFTETTNNLSWHIGSENSSGAFIVYNSSGAGAYIAYGGTSWTANSDLRLKKDIKPLGSVLEKVMQLKPVWYRFKNSDSDKLNIGFIAQDVEKVFPTIVNEGPEQKDGKKYKGLTYQDFGVIAIQAVKELNEKVDAQDKQIKELKQEIKQLKQK